MSVTNLLLTAGKAVVKTAGKSILSSVTEEVSETPRSQGRLGYATVQTPSNRFGNKDSLMSINFNELQNAGAHTASLNFGKAVEVQSGQSLNFSKDNPGVTNLRVELYWESDHDGDAAVVIADSNGKALQGLLPTHLQDPAQKAANTLYQPTRGLIWYNNLAVPGISHSGDVLTSNNDESLPEETVKINLAGLEAGAEEVVIVASTHSKTQQAIPFAELRNCKVLVINDNTNEVIYVYHMSRQFREFSSVELANFFRVNGEWQFTSMGAGVGNAPEALGDIARKYGL
ncbi:hypothetical protein VPHD148_0081 [Vibrio phage D148]